MRLDELQIESAIEADLPAIVAMLVDDVLGAKREASSNDSLPASYLSAFNAIDQDPSNDLLVVKLGDEIVGTIQLTFIPYLTYQGGTRCQIEAVRVSSLHRGKGIGEQIFLWAIEKANSRGCHMVQLTSDKQRPEAIRFYEKLGFKASHEGMKLHL